MILFGLSKLCKTFRLLKCFNVKLFAALSTFKRDGSTKLLLDLYLAKFLKVSRKPCRNARNS